jgi:hypothetical protein
MAPDGHRLCFIVAALALCTPATLARDADNANPYAVIIERNAFRLSPAPPPPAPPQPPAPDLPKVIFSGTRKKGSQWFAMFAYKTKDAQKKQETTTYISLAEGETSGPVQLVKINPNGEEVEILNTGVHVVLNMKDNGFANPGAPAASAPALPAGVRQLPGGIVIPGQPAMPGQPGTSGPPGGGGVNVGQGGGSPFGGGGGKGVMVSGQGNTTGGQPNNFGSTQPVMNLNGLDLPTSTANASRVRIGGNQTANNPTTPANVITYPIPGTSVMPPNYTPPPTGNPTGIVPPLPPIPGQ